MTPSPDPHAPLSLETRYLKWFRYLVLAGMTLAIAALAVAVPWAAYNLLQSPKPVAAPTPAPLEPIASGNAFKALIDAEARRKEEERRAQEMQRNGGRELVSGEQARVAMKYSAQAAELLNCNDALRSAVGEEVATLSEAEKGQALLRLRSTIESLADRSDRGDEWVGVMQAFVCSALRSPELADLKKQQQVGRVFIPLIEWHAREWSAAGARKAKLDTQEAVRVAQLRSAEEARVEAAALKGKLLLTVGVGALGVFCLLALYLIFARIERSLAGTQSALTRLDALRGEPPLIAPRETKEVQ